MGKAEDIYDDLIAPVEAKMVRTIARLVRDPEDAADAMQEALAGVWKNLKKIHGHSNPHAYIMRLCVSTTYDVIRRRSRYRKREVAFDPELSVTGSMRPANPLDQEERVQAIVDAIATLPPRQAKAVLLRLVAEESFEEIAHTLGCAEATARSHFSKGRGRLRKILAGRPPHEGSES